MSSSPYTFTQSTFKLATLSQGMEAEMCRTEKNDIDRYQKRNKYQNKLCVANTVSNIHVHSPFYVKVFFHNMYIVANNINFMQCVHSSE